MSCVWLLAVRRADQVGYAACDLCGGVWVETLKSLQLWASFAALHEPLPAIPDGALGLRAEACPEAQRLERRVATEAAFQPASRKVRVDGRTVWRETVDLEAQREDLRLERKRS